MQKLYSQIVGLPVFDEFSRSPIAFVRDVIIDTENGKVVAFLVKQDRIIVPMDIESFTSGLFIANKDRILPIDDVLRVHEVVKRDIHVIGEKVITEREKTLLGRAVDYSIDTTHMMLTGLYVAKIFFFFHFQERIIPFNKIVKINKGSIVVKDSQPLKEAEKAQAAEKVFA
ncbi:PRC-barrel domain-containing protein [Candidatus Peregrinibacteria bacterium]|nr:PRC-barrel domain-containing protein [Candidatus Peregrinibacteria bacterium]